MSDSSKEEIMKRLPKRLAYLLRYGALKEGLDVDDRGYVAISDVNKVPLLSAYSQDEILNEVKTSISHRNVQRYEWRQKDGNIFVRAANMRRFEQNPFHRGTQVKTLLETSMTCVMDNLEMFDLEEFQDEYIIKTMIHRLKRSRTITNKMMSVLFVPTITRVDLEGIFLTNNTLRMLWTQCPHLRGISFKNCGYIVTNTMLAQLAKNLPMLEQLNLTNCSHLTDKCLAIMSKKLTHLKMLHMAGLPLITPKSILTFLEAATELTFLDIFFLKTTLEEYSCLMKKAKESKVKLILHSPTEKLPVRKESFSDDEEDNYDEDNEDDDEEDVDNYDDDDDDFNTDDDV